MHSPNDGRYDLVFCCADTYKSCHSLSWSTRSPFTVNSESWRPDGVESYFFPCCILSFLCLSRNLNKRSIYSLVRIFCFFQPSFAAKAGKVENYWFPECIYFSLVHFRPVSHTVAQPQRPPGAFVRSRPPTRASRPFSPCRTRRSAGAASARKQNPLNQPRHQPAVAPTTVSSTGIQY